MQRLSTTLFVTALAVLGMTACNREDSMARERTIETADKASERVDEAQAKLHDKAEELTEAQRELIEETADERAKVQEKAAELNQAADKARSTRDWFTGTRDDVVREARATLDSMDARISELGSRLTTRTDLDLEARREADAALATMKDARAKAAEHLARIEGASATAWDGLRADARTAFENLDDAYAKAKNAIL